MELREYPDREMLMLQLADTIASELGAGLRSHARASFCVPGGTTPGPVFDILSEMHLDWDRVAVFLNDERWVGEDHPRSNTALIRRRFLKDRASAATYVPLHADTPAPEAALPALAEAIEPHLPISVLLLGMGADMHIASLFPGGDNLAAALDPHAPTLVAMRAEGAGEARVTLSARVLQGALNTHILILGPEKRAALDRARQLSPMEAPVRAVLPGAIIHWAE